MPCHLNPLAGSFLQFKAFGVTGGSSYGWFINYSLIIFDSSGSACMHDNAGKRCAGVFQLQNQIQCSKSVVCLAVLAAFWGIAICLLSFRKIQVLQMLSFMTETLCQVECLTQHPFHQKAPG